MGRGHHVTETFSRVTSIQKKGPRADAGHARLPQDFVQADTVFEPDRRQRIPHGQPERLLGGVAMPTPEHHHVDARPIHDGIANFFEPLQQFKFALVEQQNRLYARCPESVRRQERLKSFQRGLYPLQGWKLFARCF